jgi:Spy/CpxP family protein refolding chaperone
MFNGRFRVSVGCGVLMLMFANQLIAADWSSMELTRSTVQKERQAIVAKFMDLNESQSHAFWPVYGDYRHTVARASDGMLTNMETLIERHGILSDSQANDLLDEYLKWQQETIQTQYAYLKKFRQILTPKQVARLFQLENKMDAVVRYELAAKVPLIK